MLTNALTHMDRLTNVYDCVLVMEKIDAASPVMRQRDTMLHHGNALNQRIRQSSAPSFTLGEIFLPARTRDLATIFEGDKHAPRKQLCLKQEIVF